MENEQIQFRTFRELRDAINRMPEERLEDNVELNLYYGASGVGGTLDFSDGFAGIIANGD